ncbi:MAG: hypothetical protein LBJ02_05490 [Bifidobacteriaceae bacterium]|jgi:hypothetical protein|nr:hypothetical protein [Bifidobacteriaceae bacterium]
MLARITRTMVAPTMVVAATALLVTGCAALSSLGPTREDPFPDSALDVAAASDPSADVLAAITAYLDSQEPLIEKGQVALKSPERPLAQVDPVALDGESGTQVSIGRVDARLSDCEVVSAAGYSTVTLATVTLEIEYLDPLLPEPVIGLMTDEYLITTEEVQGEQVVTSVEMVPSPAETGPPLPKGHELPSPSASDRVSGASSSRAAAARPGGQ